MKPSFAILAFVLLIFSAGAEAKPMKVFILAGQSNMEGHAKMETIDYIGRDPDTQALLDRMMGPDGKPRVSDQVRISYLTGRQGENGTGFGKLSTGWGSRQNPQEDGGKIGPEYTFGLAMDDALDDPVLIIKTAWVGKSLYYDFRPPGAGVYPRNEKDIEKDRNPESGSGHYYRLMIDHVESVLSDPGKIHPDYQMDDGYELSGFVWFQGWNDMVNRDVYPVLSGENSGNRFAKYSDLMAQFIRDVRKDLEAPELPFVIGVMGVGGDNAKEDNVKFREAMAAPADLPEFAGNVMAVPTAPFWDDALGAIADKHQEVRQMGYLLRTENKNHANKDGTMTKEDQRKFVEKFKADLISPEETALFEAGASNAGYHYLGCAKTFALMGEAYAEAILKMNQ